MPVFKVGKSSGGSHDLSQIDERKHPDPARERRLSERERLRLTERRNPVPEPDELDDLDDGVADDLDRLDAAEDAADEPETKAPSDAPTASEALTALRAGLHKKNGDWAATHVAELASKHEVAEVRALEKTHPRFPGGRGGVLDALEERDGELNIPDPHPGLARAADEPETETVTPPVGTGFPCPYEPCEFAAGSEIGLEAHIESAHGG